MATGLSKAIWRAGCVAAALSAGVGVNQPQAFAADGPIAQASAANTTMFDAMVDAAMQDGFISADERNLIMGVARRHMMPGEVAELETRLAVLPATPSRSNKASATGDTTMPLGDAPTLAADGSNDCCDEPGCGGWFDNLYLFAASDGWMGPIDDDDGNNFGYRLGFNAGVPIDECRGIGGQFGLSYGRYNLTGRDAGREQSKVEEQLFLTAGAFKRADLCAECPDRLVLGLAYDHMISDNTGEEAWEIGRLGQLRWQIGYALSNLDEVGIFGSFRLWEDTVNGPSNNQTDIRALDQGSIYWHHKWTCSADTTIYFGIADDPGEWVWGAKGEVPLSNCVGLFGGVHYVMPSTDGGGNRDAFAQEYWNVAIGIAYYPGGNAASKTVAGRRWMPLMPVADNGTFGIDVHPGDL